jgi:sarcosine oxidase, subunit gamma
MRELIATPPLAPGRVAATAALTLEVMPAGSYAGVQVSRRDRQRGSIEVLGTPLPSEPGTYTGADPVAWWTAPDSWLVASSRYSGSALVAALESACSGQSAAIVDVSDSLVAIEVRGPSARELLSRGTGFDARAKSFRPGRGTRLSFAQIPVLLRAVDEERFEMLVDRSAARWLADWLSCAASTLS